MMDEHDGEESRTELDSHENMVVVGNHATIYYNTENKVGVRSFTPDYQALEGINSRCGSSIHMSIHGKGVCTHVQECLSSTKHGKQYNSAVCRDIIRPGWSRTQKNTHHVSICGGSQHIFSQLRYLHYIVSTWCITILLNI